MTTTVSTKQHPRTSAFDHDVAMRLAATEYDRVVALLERLTPQQWAAPTDCPGWDVRAMAGHVLGMTRMTTSVREIARQQVKAGRRTKRDGGLAIDGLTALQVDEQAHLSTGELVAEMRRLGPKAVRGRRRLPGLARRQTIDPQVVGGQEEWWTLGYLLDVILTRDPFMHRIDISRATGLTLDVTSDHEGVIVDDVVREWARRHGAAYTLDLTGPAGGHWEHGTGGEQITMDALDFCRTISGRGPATGLLTEQVPF